ncbi:MAG TPA: hypothetical protein VK995_01460, partial [Oceanipulchritudo sp.]|nr:hypothetical protein [Oceanipulchritudo sp.]
MRFLLASHLPPWPPVGGGQQRTHLLWRALKELGEVDFLLLVNRYNRREAATAKEWGPRFGLKAIVDEPTWGEGPLAKGLRRAGLGGLVHALAYHRDGGRRLLAASQPAVEATRRQLNPGDYDLIIGGYMRTVVTCGLVGGPVPVALDVDDYQPDLLR